MLTMAAVERRSYWVVKLFVEQIQLALGKANASAAFRPTFVNARTMFQGSHVTLAIVLGTGPRVNHTALGMKPAMAKAGAHSMEGVSVIIKAQEYNAASA